MSFDLFFQIDMAFCVGHRTHIEIRSHLLVILIHNRHDAVLCTDHRQMCILWDTKIHAEMRKTEGPVLKRGKSQKQEAARTASLIIYPPGMSECLSSTTLMICDICYLCSNRVTQKRQYLRAYGWSISADKLVAGLLIKRKMQLFFGDNNCFPVTDCASQSSAREIKSKGWPVVPSHCCTPEEK